MNQNQIPKCIQLDQVADPEVYLALALEGLSISVTEVTPEIDTNSDQE